MEVPLHRVFRTVATTEIHLPMSRSDIGQYVGMSLGAVSRTFRALELRGIIAIRDRRHARRSRCGGGARISAAAGRRGCAGDTHACLKRALARLPQPLMAEARQTILADTPPNISAPEREARQRTPRDLYAK